ncbi:MAG: cytidine deaminase [Ruminococcus flavefaciens]|nr:cytidine deaminase [Ruminococcus flavefaciens]
MTDNEFFLLAVKASEKSYSPYSKFRVGAVLLTKDGQVFTGCNIENSSYSMTICAERTAFFKAISSGFSDFKAIAIAGSADGDFSKPCQPCGACLQVMSEFCSDDFMIVLSDGVHRLKDFLPNRFTKENIL